MTAQPSRAGSTSEPCPTCRSFMNQGGYCPDQWHHPVNAQPSPDLPDSLRRDRKPASVRVVVADLPEVKQRFVELAELLAATTAERDKLRQHILDIDAHATPYGDLPDDPGWVGMYLLTAGALHRALGTIGHSAPKCQAEADLAAMTARAESAEAMARDCDLDERTIDGLADTAARLCRQVWQLTADVGARRD